MNSPLKRKRPNRLSQSAQSGGTKTAADHDAGTTPADASGDIADGSISSQSVSVAQKTLALAAMVHLFALAIGAVAAQNPSQTVSALAGLFGPYLQVLHFGFDDQPVDLVSVGGRQPLSLLVAATEDQMPRRLEMASVLSSETGSPFDSSSESGDVWSALPAVLPGGGADDRQQRWLSTLALLSERDQPSLVAELLRPALSLETSGEKPGFVRIVRRPTILSTVDEKAPPPYEAWVLSSDEQQDAAEWTIVCRQPARLTAAAVDPQGESE